MYILCVSLETTFIYYQSERSKVYPRSSKIQAHRYQNLPMYSSLARSWSLFHGRHMCVWTLRGSPRGAEVKKVQ